MASVEDAAEEEVVKVEAQDLVRVQICFRRTGPAGAQDPHGIVKLEILQPRSLLKQWETSRQFKTPGSPNLNIVFEGKCIRPPIAGALALGDDAETYSPAIQDAELETLQLRREGLRVDIARLEATAGQLSEQHLRTRKAYFEEEQRLQQNLAGATEQLKKMRENLSAEDGLVHDKVAKLLEMEKTIAGALNSRISKYNDDSPMWSTARARCSTTSSG